VLWWAIRNWTHRRPAGPLPSQPRRWVG
jgi:hypothetical protein